MDRLIPVIHRLPVNSASAPLPVGLQCASDLDNYESTHDVARTSSLYFKNERVATLNGRRKPLGLLHYSALSRRQAFWASEQVCCDLLFVHCSAKFKP